MTDYVKSTNFTSKDSLATGNPLKIIKGSEFDTEFNNIAVAMATKADLASPSLTGNPTAPTASVGDNDTSIATTAFVRNEIMASVYPVGSIYINAGSSTNPATLLGFGTWVAFGAGRVMVGLNSSDTLFDTLEETGGSKDAIAVSHTHTFTGTAASNGDHHHAVDYPRDCGAGGQFGTETVAGINANSFCDGGDYTGAIPISQTAGAHTHTVSGTTDTGGTSGTNANLQPYITVAMWKRTA